MPDAATDHGNGAQSVDRAIRVLFAVSGADPSGASLAELASGLQLNKATVRRLLISLQSAGLVSQEARGSRYRLGDGLIELGMAAALQNGRLAAYDQRRAARGRG